MNRNELRELIEKVDLRQSLATFVLALSKDFQENSDRWESTTVKDYLEAMSAWISDSTEWCKIHRGMQSDDIAWITVADILYAASMYE